MNLKFLGLCALISSGHLFSQGCSDAGFCTIGTGTTKIVDSTYIKKHKIALQLTNGIGDEGVYVFTPALQYDLDFRKGFSFQSRLTANYASGNLASVSAPGDLYLSASYQFSKHPKIKHVFTIGSKLPLSQSDLQADGLPLPMQYQSSLGTIDAIVLYALHLNKFTVNAGWQQALSGSNKNEFLPSLWNSEMASKYPSTNAFNRKSDILFRLTYDLITHSKIQWNAILCFLI